MAKRKQVTPSVHALDGYAESAPKIGLITIRYRTQTTVEQILEWRNEVAERLLAAVGGLERFLRFPAMQQATAEAATTGAVVAFRLTVAGQTLDIEISPTRSDAKDATLVISLTVAPQPNQAAQDPFTDPITGLANLMALIRRAEELEARRATDRRTALVLLNINRFQSFNEALGFDAANELLRVLGQRLTQHLPTANCIARLSGDEFGILVTGSTINFAQGIAQDILRLMQEAVAVGGRMLHLSGCVGIAYAGASGEELLRNAGIALRRARREGYGRCVVYHDELKIRAQAQFDLEADLRRAIETEALELHYQPVIDMATGAVAGFEALARWQHPDRGTIPPSDFIPFAEACNLIVPLGRWALNSAGRQMTHWLATYPEAGPLTCSVNVSSMQLQDESFLDDVRHVLAANALPPFSLRLEVTESAIINHADLVADLLLDLKAAGVSLALDDFGTGYSSLGYLNRFPFDTLKIDRSFVRYLNAASENYKIIHIIAHLAATLGLSTIAEGVETLEQLREIQKLGCHLAQGFYFSRPLPAADIERLFLAGQHRFQLH